MKNVEVNPITGEGFEMFSGGRVVTLDDGRTLDPLADDMGEETLDFLREHPGVLSEWRAACTEVRKTVEVRHDLTRRTDGALEDWYSLLAGGNRFGVVVHYRMGQERVYEADGYESDSSHTLVKVGDFGSFMEAVCALAEREGTASTIAVVEAVERVPFGRFLPPCLVES